MMATPVTQESPSRQVAPGSSHQDKELLNDPGASLLARVSYGIGEIAITSSMILFGLFALFFYNSVMELPGTLVGIGSALGLLWDAVLDPYIGHRSDHLSHRMGRRHPFMLVGSLTMGLSFWLLLSPPQDLGTVALFLWLLGATFLFRTTSAVFRIPYLSLGAELSSDYHERTKIVGYRSFFGLCGTLGAATLSFLLFFPDGGNSGVDPKLDYQGYPAMGMAFGLVMTLTGLISVAGTWRHRFYLSGRKPIVDSDDRHFFRGFLLALRNPVFRKIWLSFSIFFLAVVMTSVTSIHFYNWYVEVRDSETISQLQMVLYLGALFGVPVWVWIARYFEKSRLYGASIVGTIVLLVCATLLFGEGSFFGTRNAPPLIIGNLVAGIFVSAVWILPGSMLADVGDLDEFETGYRREGLFFGILNFGEKLAAGFSILLGGILLDHFVGLVPGQLEQSAVTQSRVGLIYGIVPALLLVISAAVLWGYSLDSRKLESIQEALRKRKGENRESRDDQHSF